MVKKLTILFLLVLILPVGGAQFKGISMATKLDYFCVAQYKMNDNAANTTVVDSQGYSNGTFVDATGDPNTDAHTTTGKVNTALSFDGTDDYVNTNDIFNSTWQSSFTVNIWVKPNSGSHATSWSIWGSQEVEAPTATRWLGIDVAGILYVEYDTSEDAFSLTSSSAVFPIDGSEHSWTMLTVTIEQVSITQITGRLYINGAEITSATDSLDMSTWDSIDNLEIGRQSIDALYFTGSIDDATIYNWALSQTAIDYLYNNGDGREL